MASKRNQKREQKQKLDSTQDNINAQKDGPSKVKYTLHDMKNVRPRSDSQFSMVRAFDEDKHILSVGSPGTGKTYLDMTFAFTEVLSPDTDIDHMIIVRSCVPTRDIGFLPGTMAEKMEPYEAPYMDITSDLFDPMAYGVMKDQGLIEFVPTSFVRGLSWDNAVIVIDEVQNMTMHEVKSVITRAGRNSRIYISGDSGQNDFTGTKEESCIHKLTEICSLINDFATIEFRPEDVLRSGVVREFLLACEISEVDEPQEGMTWQDVGEEELHKRHDLMMDLTSTYGVVLCAESFEEFMQIMIEVIRRKEVSDGNLSGEGTENVLKFEAKVPEFGEVDEY